MMTDIIFKPGVITNSGRIISRERDYIGPDGRARRKWLLECPLCKKHYRVLEKHIVTGHTTSCGCLRTTRQEPKQVVKPVSDWSDERIERELQRVWKSLWILCNVPNSPHPLRPTALYLRKKYYAGIYPIIMESDWTRGATTWKEAMTRFNDGVMANPMDRFVKDMRKNYIPGMKLKRKNPELFFTRDNLEWVWPEDGYYSNTVVYNGERIDLMSACAYVGISPVRVDTVSRKWRITTQDAFDSLTAAIDDDGCYNFTSI